MAADPTFDTSPDVPAAPIWADAAHRTPRRYTPLIGDASVDVAVIGGGLTGLSTALMLARAGRSVALVEARRIGDGTTGRSTAKVSALQGTRYGQLSRIHGVAAAEAFARAQTDAFAWIERQVHTLGIDCDWQRRSAITFATTDQGRKLVEEEAVAARASGLHVYLDPAPGVPLATTAAVALDDQAQFSPLAYLDALAVALDAMPKASVFESSRVTSIRGRGPHRVVTAAGSLEADDVVVATLLPITNWGLFFARARPMASYTLAVQVDGEPPKDMAISAESPTRSLRTARFGGDEVLLVGGESSGVADGPRPSEAVKTLEAWAREHLATSGVVRAWSAHDYVPVDHLPWVGPASALTPRLFVATGFEKWGITMGTAAAQMLTSRLTGETPPESSPAAGSGWGIFDPGRVVSSSWASLARLNAKVATRLAHDWIRPDEAPDANGRGRRYRSGLAPQGDPVPDDGSSLRVRCTHLGGVCRWNDLDRTWDCPLHGSRFEADGTVLCGPAVRPLAKH